jgi:hypothetical protein
VNVYVMLPIASRLLSPLHRFAFEVELQVETTETHSPTQDISVESTLVQTFWVPGPAGGGVVEPEGVGVWVEVVVEVSELSSECVIVSWVAAECQ